MKHLISIRDITKKEILNILKIAEEIDKKPQKSLLSGKILATLFFEPSTRTRLSFASAMNRLGGDVLGFDSEAGTSRKKGETLFDTIKMIEGYADICAIRHYNDGAARLAANSSKIPIINAGDGANQHPTQTLLDLYTIKKSRGNLNNLKIGFVGDLKYGRTVHSLAKALKLFDAEMYFVAPELLKMPKLLIEELKESKIVCHETEDLDAVIPQLDILYMTRIQKERFPDPIDYEKVKDVYKISKKTIVPLAKKSMKIMHPLPRVNEINTDLDDTPYALYFEQAHNGIPTRQAVLSLLLGAKK